MKLLNIFTLLFAYYLLLPEVSCRALPISEDELQGLSDNGQVQFVNDFSNSVNEEGYRLQDVPSRNDIFKNEPEQFVGKISSVEQNALENIRAKSLPAYDKLSETNTGNRALPRVLTDALKFSLENKSGVKMGAQKDIQSLKNVPALDQKDLRNGAQTRSDAGLSRADADDNNAAVAQHDEEHSINSNVILSKNDKESSNKTISDATSDKIDKEPSSNGAEKANSVDKLAIDDQGLPSSVDDLKEKQSNNDASVKNDLPPLSKAEPEDTAVNDQPSEVASKTSVKEDGQGKRQDVVVPTEAKMQAAGSSPKTTASTGTPIKASGEEESVAADNSKNVEGSRTSFTEATNYVSSYSTGTGATGQDALSSKAGQDALSPKAGQDAPSSKAGQDAPSSKAGQNVATSVQTIKPIPSGSTTSLLPFKGSSTTGVTQDVKPSFEEEDSLDDVDYLESAGDNPRVPVHDINQGFPIENDNFDPIRDDNPDFPNEELDQPDKGNSKFSNDGHGDQENVNVKEFNGGGYLPESDAESHFGYLVFLTILAALAYLLYLKRKKILALLLEGRRSSSSTGGRRGSISRRPRSRSSSSSYSLLRPSGGEDAAPASPDSKESSDHTRLERIY